MNKQHKVVSFLLAFFMSLAIFATGCGKQAQQVNSGAQTSLDSEPVTLTVYAHALMSDDDFQKLFVEPVQKKHPNITLQKITLAQGQNLDSLVASGQTPDMILDWNSALTGYNGSDLLLDLNPLIKKMNFNLDRFDPAFVKTLQGEKGEQYGIPYAVNRTVMFYNKDIFDKFGIPYPKDGLTWDETIDLAKKLSQTDSSGQHYYGLDVESLTRMAHPLGMTYLDKTEKPIVTNENWRTVFETTKKVYTIPGNEPQDVLSTKGQDRFLNRNLAMFTTTLDMVLSGKLGQSLKDGGTFNWDFAQYPSYSGHIGINGEVDEHFGLITTVCKHPEAALEVLNILTSNEVQTYMTRSTGRVTPLKDPAIKKQFGADLPYMQGKNIDAIYKSNPIPPVNYTRYDGKAGGIINNSFKDYYNGKDLNTALQEASDGIAKMVADLKSQQ